MGAARPLTRPAGDSRAEYERRIHRVVAHIDAHLDGALDLETLAGVAHFSPFHFHRLFQAWTGETLGDYLRRRRLEVGALRLLSQPATPVLDVALTVGFGSGEAFARAFRQRFGCSPSAWREERKHDQVDGKHGQADSRAGGEDGGSSSHRDENAMNVTLTEMPAVPIAYLRHTGSYGPPILRFWADRVAPWMAENDLFGRVRYGIAHDDPGITESAKCRYDAAVELPLDAVVTGQPLRTTLPGGRYACLPFEGTVDEIDAAWHRLIAGWLPGSGLQLDARPMLEHYPLDARFDAATGVFSCNLCIPVVPL